MSESFNAKKLRIEIYLENVILLVKQRISVFESLCGISSNVCDLSLARWKADSQFSVGYNWTFSLILTTEALIHRNPPLSKGVGKFRAK